MNQAVPAGSFQVTLTGRRLSPVTDADLLQRLQEQFGLNNDQAVQLLVGPLIVRQSLEVKFAAKVASAFRACGMEALVEPMTGAEPAVPVPAAAPSPASALPPAAAQPATPLAALAALASQAPPASRLDLDRERQIRRGGLLVAAVRASYVVVVLAVAVAWALSLVRSVLSLGDLGVLGSLYSLLVPGLGALALIGLLLWPLLAPRKEVPGRLRLDPAQEPEFFRGLAGLCAALGVPEPGEVIVDGDASVGIKPRPDGRIRLRIGLALLASLPSRETVGLLSQQLALQAGGRGLLRVLEVQRWLQQRAYDADLWDEALARRQERVDSGAGRTLGRLLVAGLGVGRLLMAGLYRLSLLLGAKARRIASHEADRRAALLVGSRLFPLMLRNQRAVEQAADEVRALASSPSATPGRQLPEDLFEAIASQFRAIDAASLSAIDAELENEHLELLPGSPPWGERLARVRQQQAAPVYASSLPSRLLLEQCELYCLKLSRDWYEREGIAAPASTASSAQTGLTPAMRAAREMQRETLERYFNGQFRPWPLLQAVPPVDSDITGLGWQGTIDTLRRRSPEMTQDWVAAAEWERRRAPLLLAAGLAMKPSYFGVSGYDHLAQADLWRLLEQVRRRDTDAHHRLAEDLKLHAFRLDCAIRALMDQERLQAEFLRTLLQRMHEMEGDAAMLAELQRSVLALQTIAADGEHPDAQKDLNEALRLFRGHATRLLNAGHSAAQTVLEGGSVSGYLLLRCPLAGPERMTDAARYLQDAGGMVDAFQDLYQAALGELASLCERAERACAIRPIRRIDPMSLGL
jgi:hypothetical protein